ncbi:MAG: shikimate dehydrogenase [Pseudomonadales bacterium]|nr:shikimate dehydrogenase [Pseudomonadales bacterium]
MTDQYAVIGNPIAQSKSPEIHRAFAQQTGQDMNYTKLLAPIDQFKEEVKKFFSSGGKGLNITVPFKLQAWQLAQVRSDRAELAGSANTLLVGREGRLYADNTDGIGLARDILRNQQGTVTGKKILILGAGGAVRGVLSNLLAEKPKQLVIANRTLSKATQLADLFSKKNPIRAIGYDQLTRQQFDWVINGTAASLQNELPPLPGGILRANAWCYDMMYGAQDTVFMQWAKEQGAAKVMDGLGMLVEQAAEAFFIWRHVRPQTQPVIEQIRGQLV